MPETEPVEQSTAVRIGMDIPVRIGIHIEMPEPRPIAAIRPIPMITTNAIANGAYAEVRKMANLRDSPSGSDTASAHG